MSKERIIDTYLQSSVVMKGDYPYFVNSISDGNPAVTKELLDEITDNLIEVSELDCDIILAPEAMAIQYATAVTLRTGIPFQIIRKRSSGLADEIKITTKTGYSTSDMFTHAVPKAAKVAIIDDVISTGGTLKALVAALRDYGLIVTEAIIILNKSNDIPKISNELGIPIRTVIDVGVEDGKPIVR